MFSKDGESFYFESTNCPKSSTSIFILWEKHLTLECFIHLWPDCDCQRVKAVYSRLEGLCEICLSNQHNWRRTNLEADI